MISRVAVDRDKLLGPIRVRFFLRFQAGRCCKEKLSCPREPQSEALLSIGTRWLIVSPPSQPSLSLYINGQGTFIYYVRATSAVSTGKRDPRALTKGKPDRRGRERTSSVIQMNARLFVCTPNWHITEDGWLSGLGRGNIEYGGLWNRNSESLATARVDRHLGPATSG